MLLPLLNQVQRYAWGSPTLIQRLCGWPIDSQLIAEIWYGTHPRAPSRLANDGTSLRDHVQQDLPFLLKLIAVDHPLSLQAHPNAEIARLGYEHEQAQGIPLTARERCYPDPHHKPELLVALSAFEALVGFESPVTILATLSPLALPPLGCPELQPILAPLRDNSDIAATFALLLNCSDSVKASLLGALQRLCAQFGSSRLDAVPDEIAAKYETAQKLLRAYPGDLGAVVSLFLRRIILQPGEGLYLAPGTLHAYLNGLGVEIMANSDNVLRCGLTPKYVNVPELLKVLDVTATPVVLPGRLNSPSALTVSQSETLYPVAAREFLLSRIELTPSTRATFTAQGPELLLAVHGKIAATTHDGAVDLLPGAAAFVPPDCSYVLSGEGQCFRARPG
jgi:mannose-6-phosphate isomerase